MKGREIWKVHQHYKVIGQMHTIPVTAGECFYLRGLLTTAKGMSSTYFAKSILMFHFCIGATSFEGQLYDTFKGTSLLLNKEHLISQSYRNLFREVNSL